MLILKVLSTVINIILMLIIVPICLIIFLPLGLYRILISLLAKILKPNLLKMVDRRDTVFANESNWTTPNSTIVISLFLEGDLDIETIRNTIIQKVFGGNCALNSNLPCAVLMQTFENWCGFVFMKWETNFDIKDHIWEWRKPNENMSTVTPEDFYFLRQKLLKEPYKHGTSAWEYILVRNYQENEHSPKGTIVVSRFHHGLMDGYSLIKFFVSYCSNVKDINSAFPVPHAISKPLTMLQSFGIFSKLFIEAPTTAFNQFPQIDPANIFHPSHPQNKSNFTGKRHPLTVVIPLKTVKDAAKQSKTSYTAVIMAGLTGGVRNYLISKNANVPATIDCTIPLPWPGHDVNKVKNHFTFAVIQLPTGVNDHLHRLQNVQDQFVGLKSSSVPAFNYVMSFLVGMLPNPIMTAVLKETPSSILLSSLPGPNFPMEFFGRTLLQPPLFEGGYGKGKLGLGVAMPSCSGIVGITINPEASIISTKEDAEELLKNIVNEIQLMHDSTFV